MGRHLNTSRRPSPSAQSSMLPAAVTHSPPPSPPPSPHLAQPPTHHRHLHTQPLHLQRPPCTAVGPRSSAISHTSPKMRPAQVSGTTSPHPCRDRPTNLTPHAPTLPAHLSLWMTVPRVSRLLLMKEPSMRWFLLISAYAREGQCWAGPTADGGAGARSDPCLLLARQGVHGGGPCLGPSQRFHPLQGAPRPPWPTRSQPGQ